MKRTLYHIFLHTLAWAGYFSLPILLMPDRNDPRFNRSDPPAAQAEQAPARDSLHAPKFSTIYPLGKKRSDTSRPGSGIPDFPIFILFNALLLGFFYFNSAVLLPNLWKRYNARVYLAGAAGCALLVLGIPNVCWLLFRLMSNQQDQPPVHIFSNMVMLINFGLVLAVSNGLWFASEYRKSEQRRLESDNARLDAELAQLKTQFNPHFLFNTLHGIYSLTIAKSDTAPDAVMRLSQLMRYVLTEGNADVVPVGHDIDQLRAFVQLNQLRMTDKTPVHFSVEGIAAEGQKIAPLLLLPFVENAFKFGVSTREVAPIEIRIVLNHKELAFYCTNRMIRKTASTAEPSGIGIHNTRRRLELMYPGKYKLEIGERDGKFKVYLIVQLGA